MLVSELLRILDRSAPFSLAEPWDNCGLLVGDESAPAVRVLVTLELAAGVLDEAVARPCDTVLSTTRSCSRRFGGWWNPISSSWSRCFRNGPASKRHDWQRLVPADS